MSWPGLKELDELAKRICEDFAAKFPPSMQDDDKPQARKQLAVALLSVDQNIGGFLAAQPKPGVIKKAKCANEVKWGLKNLGFGEHLIAMVTDKVIYGLSRTPSGKNAKPGSRQQ